MPKLPWKTLSPSVFSQARLRELALQQGFTLCEQPDGTLDLAPEVYRLARALLEELT